MAVHAEVQPALAAELEKLFSRAREQPLPSATVAGSGASVELEGEMARTAATTLHAALLELISLTQTDDEMSHVCGPTRRRRPR